jgi:hypothetical protein
MRMKPPADLLPLGWTHQSNFGAQLVQRTLVPSKPQAPQKQKEVHSVCDLAHCGTRHRVQGLVPVKRGLRWISIKADRDGGILPPFADRARSQYKHGEIASCGL